MESELFQTVRLPYGKYEDSDAPKPYNLTILLPCEGKTTADILAWLSAKHVADLSQQMKMEEVQIRLPRFETEVRTNLLDVLITLGIPFNDNDLRGFVLCSEKPWGISVSDILQCARIKVNEKGTEAGAVTMDICTSGLPTKTFNADHPFVYLLTERQTGTILFLGTYHGNE